MSNNTMNRIQSIAIGCLLGLLIFVGFGFAYRATRHLIAESGEVVVLGAPTDVRWIDASPPPAGLGLVSNTPLIATVPISHGGSPTLTANHAAMFVSSSGVQHVRMESRDVVPIDAELASRQIVNRFGAVVLAWRCFARGAIARDGSEFYLSLEPSGGGDAGYTVSFNAREVARAEFKLTITERLWRNTARQCELHFRVNDDGTIQRAHVP